MPAEVAYSDINVHPFALFRKKGFVFERRIL